MGTVLEEGKKFKPVYWHIRGEGDEIATLWSDIGLHTNYSTHEIRRKKPWWSKKDMWYVTPLLRKFKGSRWFPSLHEAQLACALKEVGESSPGAWDDEAFEAEYDEYEESELREQAIARLVEEEREKLRQKKEKIKKEFQEYRDEQKEKERQNREEGNLQK